MSKQTNEEIENRTSGHTDRNTNRQIKTKKTKNVHTDTQTNRQMNIWKKDK